MTKYRIGKVAPTPKGVYDETVRYAKLDFATDESGNSLYMSKVDDNVGHALTDTDYWMQCLDASEQMAIINSAVEDIEESVENVQAQADQSRQDIQDIVNSLAVVQTTGQSATAVMSQKAVTDELTDIYKEFGDEKLIPPSEMTSQSRVISESTLKWTSFKQMSCKLMAVENDYRYIKITANTSYATVIGFLKQDGAVSEQAVFSYENPTYPIIIPTSESKTFKIPSDCNLVYFYNTDSSGINTFPQEVKVIISKELSFEPYTFEQGSIALNGIDLVDTADSIRTGYFAINRITTIKLKAGYKIHRLFAYNADKTLKATIILNGTSNTQLLENTTLWYRMVVAKSDNSAIIPDDNCVDLTINEKLNEDFFDSPSRCVFVAAYNSPARDQKRADYVCTGTNDELVIQQAVNDQRIRYGGTLQLLDGTYYIDSFPNTDSDGHHVAILFRGAASDNARVLDVTGTTRNKGYNSEWGVSIHVTSTAIAAMNNTDTYVIFKGTNTRPSLYPDYTFINTVNFYKMNIYIGEAEKKMVGIDMTYFSASFLEDIQVWTESYNAKRMNHKKPLTPVVGSVGVKTMNGSNDMCRVRWSFVTCCGMHKGFVVRSVDHLIMMNCAACRCVYGFYFENGTPKASLTLISCIDEGCVHLPYFGGSGHITAFSFAVERFNYRYYPDDPSGNTEFYAQEATPGNWIGTIEYTIQGWSSANGTTLTGTAQHFWKDNGSGKCIRTRNLNSDHTGYSQPNAGEYLEQYFDTTTNTWKTWNGSAWV